MKNERSVVTQLKEFSLYKEFDPLNFIFQDTPNIKKLFSKN